MSWLNLWSWSFSWGYLFAQSFTLVWWHMVIFIYLKFTLCIPNNPDSLCQLYSKLFEINVSSWLIIPTVFFCFLQLNRRNHSYHYHLIIEWNILRYSLTWLKRRELFRNFIIFKWWWLHPSSAIVIKISSKSLQPKPLRVNSKMKEFTLIKTFKT